MSTKTQSASEREFFTGAFLQVAFGGPCPGTFRLLLFYRFLRFVMTPPRVIELSPYSDFTQCLPIFDAHTERSDVCLSFGKRHGGRQGTFTVVLSPYCLIALFTLDRSVYAKGVISGDVLHAFLMSRRAALGHGRTDEALSLSILKEGLSPISVSFRGLPKVKKTYLFQDLQQFYDIVKFI